MSHQDKDGHSVRFNAEYLKQSLNWLLCPVIWSRISFRADCSWTPLHLAATALLWAWSDEATLQDRLFAARRLAKYIYQPQREFATSWQAFIKILVRWTTPLMLVIQTQLRRRMEETLAASWEVHDFVLFGVDGSRIDVPRTRSHEAVNAPGRDAKRRKLKRHRRKKTPAKGHDKKATVPQIWLTILWHVGTGLPWAWRMGPTGSSERDHWMQMLEELPDAALITGDAGFVGYEYLKEVIDSGRHLLIRVGSNVRLLRKLGWVRESAGTVYLWPDYVAQKRQLPIVLRLVVVQGEKYPIYLVTTVSATRLSDSQVGDVYRRRWGIEVYFRHLKQTFQRRKLRSHSAENAQVELEWSLLGLWCMALYAQAEQSKYGLLPQQLSIAGILRAFRRMMRDYRHPIERHQSLSGLLRLAVKDTYQRQNKSSRNYARKKNPDPPAGPPEVLTATRAQIRNAKELRAAA